ncbi:MAG: ATP-binding protein [Phycisphaerae bacterium]|jgi:two-component system phosphate regulon sensor histidine kinase PhoR|nr:ATP-binding protein [Phycisphaerae bacterium]
MKRFSLLIKLFMGNLLLAGIVIAVGLIVSYRHLNTSYMRNNRTHQDRAAEVTRRYYQDLWPMPEPRVNQAAGELFAGSAMRLTVIASDGRVLGDSIADPKSMSNHKTPDRPEVLAAIEGRNGSDTRLSETTRVEYRYITRPVRQGETVVALVRLAMPVRAIAEDQALIRNALFWTISATVGAAAMLALLMSWIWYAPLRQITETAEQLAAGNLDARAKVSGTDELARLAGTLNDMRNSLAKQIHAVETQQQQLRSVVDNLREGVISLDKTGHIVLVNRSARELLDLGAEDLTGREFKSVVTGGGVLEVYHKLMSAGESIDAQVELPGDNRRILDVNAGRVAAGAPGGIAVLLVLRDVTDIAGAAAMKAEFVANASHELRTPLATIRAAAETLTDTGGDPEAVAKVAAILQRHIMRLEHMTNDLLNLHLVETTGAGANLTDISLASLVALIREDHDVSARSRQIELVVLTDSEDFVFASDPTLLQLIVDNLLDNALKFTPVGGKVTCTLTGGADNVTLEVADTGCGMPPEIQGRVFERFFQARTSRSGDANLRGTGLGLAIVKHATDRLGGEVTLESRPDEGTTVTVTLPRAPRGD